MKKLAIFLCILTSFLLFVNKALASSNPNEKPNNKVGIHILFPEELEKAASLVNSEGGEWGYATIPIQIGDLNREKWQKFMDEAKKYRLIPIVRLATEPYRNDTSVWRKPTAADILDFANFLDGIKWPVKNRYVILFNEVNRFDEWGGESPNPGEYAALVDYAVNVFERRNKDFFVITAGLDNASPNDRVKYMDNMVYLREMELSVPGVFEKVEGISSHSYPNPGFSQAPSTNKVEGTATYRFENDLLENFTGARKPVFLTETGWDAENIGWELASKYLSESFNDIWLTDDEVVAVTPFLLDAGASAFTKFGFVENGVLNENGEALTAISKVKGEPELSPEIHSANTLPRVSPVQEFTYAQASVIDKDNASGVLKEYFKTILGVK